MPDHDENLTGTSNAYYNLVSVMYHSLKGAQTYETYVKDAETSGDQELAQFFRQVQQDETLRADRAKQLLWQRVSQTPAR